MRLSLARPIRLAALILAAMMCVSCSRSEPSATPPGVDPTKETMGPVSEAKGPTKSSDSPVTSRGNLEVTAKLLEIPEGAIFKRDLYDYATVLKYQVLQVHRGKVDGE